jgi:hypothetical protein
MWTQRIGLRRPINKAIFQKVDTEIFARNPFRLPYHILVKTCLGVVMDSLNPSLPPNEKVTFVFEDNNWKHAVIDGYDVFKRLHSQSLRFGTIAFEPKIGLPGLQAADLLAWGYRRLKALQLGYAKRKPERSFLSLLCEDFVFKHLTKAALEDELKKAMNLIFKWEDFLSFVGTERFRPTSFALSNLGLAVFHPNHGKSTVSRKSADAIAPRAQVLCANDSCTAGEFSAGTLNEGNSGELLLRICSAVRTAEITR